MNSQSTLYVLWLDFSKNFIVDPPASTPYLISVCCAKSSADLMGLSRVSTVKNAAKFAVYEAIINIANRYQTPANNLKQRRKRSTEVVHIFVKVKL